MPVDPYVPGGQPDQPVGPGGFGIGSTNNANNTQLDPNYNTGGTYAPQSGMAPGAPTAGPAGGNVNITNTGPQYDQFDQAGFQNQGDFGNARSDPWSGPPPDNSTPIPPQPPPTDGPGGEIWEGGNGLYGGIWGAMSPDMQQQYLGLQAQDPNLQPMAGGGEQSNVARRQAMWSILNADNTYSNSPANWGNFGGDDWAGYEG